VWRDVHLLLTVLISAVVSGAVSLWFGPYLIIRQAKARRALEVRGSGVGL
jgi:hypothetical protein